MLAAALLFSVGSCSTSQESPGTGPPRIISLTADQDTIAQDSVLQITAEVSDPDGLQDIVGGKLFDAAARSYGDLSRSDKPGRFTISLAWPAINAVSPIDAPMGGAVREFEAGFIDRASLYVSSKLSVRLVCQPDPALALCAGQCVDLDTDPENCQACGQICPSTELEHARPVCGAKGCTIGCAPGFGWQSDRCARLDWQI